MIKSSNKNVITIIVVIAALIVFGFVYVRTNTIATKESSVQLPAIELEMTAADGANHKINIQFSLLLDSKNKDMPYSQKEALNSQIEEKIKSLDYDEITGKNGHEILKREVSSMLNNELGYDSGVYITSFTQDVKLSGSATGKPSKYDKIEKWFGK